MNLKPFLTVMTIVTGLACATSVRAQNVIDWIAGGGDFLADLNWDPMVTPSGTDIAVINNGGTATIAANAGAFDLRAIRLGTVEGGTESGHVIMNGGVLTLSGSAGDPKAVIGFSATLSTFIMNGGTILFDGPDLFPGSRNDDGLNGLDWEVGEKGLGRFEMHDSAVFRGGDDLKIAENSAGRGSCLIDGHAILSVGSGISLSSGGSFEQTFVIAGNALVESGNSMGAGNPQGSTDEGYLTMAIGGGRAKLTIQDHGVLNIRRLTAREGVSTILVKDHGQFHIFDVLAGKGFIDNLTPPDRPAETQFNSSYGTAGTSDATLILQDDAIMTVNAGPATTEDPHSGLNIGGRRGGGDGGGLGTLIVRDRASFRVAQDLAVGDGAGASSRGTLKVIGADAKVSIGGDLNLAYHGPISASTPGIGRSHYVITGSAVAKVAVAGTARISNGILKVSLDGYYPFGGESYTLLQAGAFDGEFLESDFSEAPLANGLSWVVEYLTDSVVLKVAGTAAGFSVTTTDNTSGPADGKISLLEAMQMAQPGDTIRFNIPGAGPHVIETPIGGYPLITADNLTIDGYSQPGSKPNTNPILGGNNAKLQIILDSRDNGSAPEDPQDPALMARRSTRLLFDGFGDEENAVLGVKEAKDVTIRGLSFLSRHTPEGADDPNVYCVAFAHGPTQAASGGRVQGCWFGLHPDGHTVAGGRSSVSTFNGGGFSASGLVIGTDGDGINDRAEFNVHIAMELALNLQAESSKASGNYVNVFPDGNTFVDIDELAAEVGAVKDPENPDPDPSTIEFYENANAMSAIIGTDGDGVADADERNIVSNVAYSETMEFWRAAQNVVVAGNYFGVGVDGITPSPVSVNEQPDFVRLSRVSSNIRVGSNGDGVSDDIEGNLIVNTSGDRFVTPGNGKIGDIAEIAVRRNKLVNCGFPAVPFSNAETAYVGYYVDVVADSNVAAPILRGITNGIVFGSFAEPNAANYPFVLIDIYTADPAALADARFWPAPMVHPSTWLGSFEDNGPGDLDPNQNEFAFNLTALGLAATTYVSAAVTYSQEAGVANVGLAVTSPMSNPVSGRPSLKIRAAAPDMVELSWLAAAGSFELQMNKSFKPTDWLGLSGATHTSGRNVLVVPVDLLTASMFFRLVSP